jgi:hypothetical protein
VNDEQLALLRTAVEAHEPQLLPLVEEIGRRRLNVFERDRLRVALEQELVARGVDERDEQTAYGSRIQRVIAELDGI